MLPETKIKEFSDPWFSTAWPSDVTASSPKKCLEIPKCRSTELSKDSPNSVFKGHDPILLATVTTLNCGIIWCFLVAIKAMVALLSIMINYASGKETN